MRICLKTIRNEKGSAIIIVLFLLTILTIIGISASNTTDVDLNIAGNDRLFRTAFYGAEGGTGATAKRVSQIVDSSEVPPESAEEDGGLKYNDATPVELYDEVFGLKVDVDDPVWDADPDMNFKLSGVGLPSAEVEIDLKRLAQQAPAGESAEFGTGAEALGGKTIIVIPYALNSVGQTDALTKARIRSVYYKYKDKPGGI